MGISGTPLSNLIAATLSRYGVSGAEATAISASATSGYIGNFIQTQINTRLAGPPTSKATRAIFSSGTGVNGDADAAANDEANAIAEDSDGTIYSINLTQVGQYIRVREDHSR
jgi:hypothetical protein